MGRQRDEPGAQRALSARRTQQPRGGAKRTKDGATSTIPPNHRGKAMAERLTNNGDTSMRPTVRKFTNQLHRHPTYRVERTRMDDLCLLTSLRHHSIMARHVSPRGRSRRALYTTTVRSVLGALCCTHNRHEAGAIFASGIIVLCTQRTRRCVLHAQSPRCRGKGSLRHLSTMQPRRTFEYTPRGTLLLYTYVRTCA